MASVCILIVKTFNVINAIETFRNYLPADEYNRTIWI